MIRTLALASSYPKAPGDGTAPFIRSISHGLAEHDVSVNLLVPYHPKLQWPESDPPVRLHTYRYLPSAAPASWHVWGYGAALVSDQKLRLATFGVLPAAAVSALTSLLCLARDGKPNVLHAHWLLPAGPIVAAVARVTGTPYVVSLHGSGAFLAERIAWLRPLTRWTLMHADRITACSSDLARRAVALGAGSDRVATIPYGVDADKFTPDRRERARSEVRGALDIGDGRILALAVGRLVAKKGFDHLIDALADGPDLHLVVAGSGDAGEELRRRVEAYDLTERVLFTGELTHDRVPDLYAAADLLVVPSVVDADGNVDGLPNVILEGMASGLPIVASRVAGIPDVLHHDHNGWLVPPSDSDALRSALIRLSADHNLRERLGRAARADVEAKYRWQAISEGYATVLREAARSTP